jgi:CHAT domain-containing protein
MVSRGGTDVAALMGPAQAVERLVIDPLEIGDTDDLVIVPAGPLASLPWSLLPSLEHRSLVLTGSATSWMRRSATSLTLDRDPQVMVVAGPDVNHAQEEIDAVAKTWNGRAHLLVGRAATVDNFMDGLATAEVVHIAAHGSHRGDNPMLSAIRLWDGLLTGYELSRVEHCAAVVVLSCCDTGMADTTSGLGLARLLTDSGVSTTIASVSPVLDQSAPDLMGHLHQHLAAGVSPARALTEARRAVGGTRATPSSAGFLCFGYG